MNCETLIAYLSDYIDHELDEALTEEAQEHLSTCHNCRVVLDSTTQTILLYRQHSRADRIPAERRQTLFDQLHNAFQRRPTK